MEGREAIWRVSRGLYITALSIFVITIVIGILNGIDLVAFSPESDGALEVDDPAGRQALLTHLHAGTLGFITLAITAGLFRLFTGSEVTAEVGRRARLVGIGMGVTIGLYVVAFAFTQDILRPVAGTLVFIAVAFLFDWVIRQMRSMQVTIPQFALFMALVSLVIGAIFGVLLGIYKANESTSEAASRINELHPATMIIGYLILAGLGLAEWLIADDERTMRADRAGVWQVSLVFLAGIVFLIGILAESDAIITLNAPLEVAGIVIFVTRMRKELRPARWGQSVPSLYGRLSIVWLIAGLAVLIRLVAGLASEEWLDFEDIPRHLVLALDHLTFIGAIAMVTFGLIAATVSLPNNQGWWVLGGINVGFVFFVAGLLADVTVLKRIGTPIMGTALLAGIWLYIRALREAEREPVPIA